MLSLWGSQVFIWSGSSSWLTRPALALSSSLTCGRWAHASGCLPASTSSYPPHSSRRKRPTSCSEFSQRNPPTQSKLACTDWSSQDYTWAFSTGSKMSKIYRMLTGGHGCFTMDIYIALFPLNIYTLSCMHNSIILPF